MGGCNSSEPKSSANATAGAPTRYNLWGPKNQRPGVFTLDPKGSKRCDGATENLAVHDGAILGIASAGAGEFLTCGEDKTIGLHDIVGKSGCFRNRFSYTGHSKAVTRAVYGEATALLYSCSRDTTVRQWDRSKTVPEAARVFEGHDLACTALALSADERTLCSGSRDTSLRLWDVETGICKASASVPRNLVTCVKHLPAESPSVVQGGEDLRIRVWDAREGSLRPAMTIEGYEFFPVCLDVSEDGVEILTSCKGFNGVGCETKLWDLRYTAAPVREFTGHTQDTTACVFVQDNDGDRSAARKAGEQGLGEEVVSEAGGGQTGETARISGLVATASKDETIKIYDLSTGQIVVDHSEHESGCYTGLAFQRDPRTGCPVFYASTITGGLYVLRLEAGEGEGEERGLRLRCVGFVQGNEIL